MCVTASLGTDLGFTLKKNKNKSNQELGLSREEHFGVPPLHAHVELTSIGLPLERTHQGPLQRWQLQVGLLGALALLSSLWPSLAGGTHQFEVFGSWMPPPTKGCHLPSRDVAGELGFCKGFPSLHFPFELQGFGQGPSLPPCSYH